MRAIPLLVASIFAVSPAAVFGETTTPKVEDCISLQADTGRLACYDAIFKPKPSATPAAPAVPSNWHVRNEVSKIDDTKSVFLSTGALDPYPDEYRTSRYPVLFIRCLENTTSLIIDFDGDYMSDSRYWGPVVMRIDQRPATEHPMTASTDNHALGLWRGGSAIPVIKSLMGGDRLLVRAVPVSSSPVTFEFDISGIDEAIKPVRDACGW